MDMDIDMDIDMDAVRLRTPFGTTCCNQCAAIHGTG